MYKALKWRGKKTFKVGVPMDIPKTTDTLISLTCYWGQHTICIPINEQGKCSCDCHLDKSEKDSK